MKIVPKLTSALVAGMFLVVAVNAALRVRRDTSVLDAERRKKDDLVARCVVAAFDSAWRAHGEAGAVAQLSATMESIDALDARWVPVEAAEPLPIGHETLASLARAPNGVPVLVASPGANEWYTYIPFEIEGRRRGHLEIVDHGPGSRSNARRILFEAAQTAAALVAASAVIAFLLNQWLIGRPVRELSEKARRIARGKFGDPLEVKTNDELGALAVEMNAMSERLVTTLEQLRHADRLATIGKVAAGVAHELGTPLNVVSARAEMIASGNVSPEDTKQYAHVITGAVERMTETVRQLLRFARRNSVSRASVDVAAVTRTAVDLLRPVARKHQVEIEVEAEPSTPSTLADAAQLQQVVTNVVMNAVHASREGSRVDVRIGDRTETPPVDVGGNARRCVCIDVVDQGEGIAAEDMPRIFEPFFTTKDVGQGTGLGLAVSYGIVRDHGGWFRVESTPGEGTSFTVCLPLETPA